MMMDDDFPIPFPLLATTTTTTTTAAAGEDDNNGVGSDNESILLNSNNNGDVDDHQMEESDDSQSDDQSSNPTEDEDSNIKFGDSLEKLFGVEGLIDRKELGDYGIWTLSSCKVGFGIDQLRDDNNETFWQSDGPQPHTVNIQFMRKTMVKEVAIYLDFKQDESYTPSKISIRAGTSFQDLQEVITVILEEPCGWVLIPLEEQQQHLSDSNNCTSTDSGLMTHIIQVAILLNHQNGRDSHIRQIKLFNTRNTFQQKNHLEDSTNETLQSLNNTNSATLLNSSLFQEKEPFTSQEYSQYSLLR